MQSRRLRGEAAAVWIKHASTCSSCWGAGAGCHAWLVLLLWLLFDASCHRVAVPRSVPQERIKEANPKTIILSGGPNSVHVEGAPRVRSNCVAVGWSASGWLDGLLCRKCMCRVRAMQPTMLQQPGLMVPGQGSSAAWAWCSGCLISCSMAQLLYCFGPVATPRCANAARRGLKRCALLLGGFLSVALLCCDPAVPAVLPQVPDGFFEYCKENSIPVLGICYGMQVRNALPRRLGTGFGYACCTSLAAGPVHAPLRCCPSSAARALSSAGILCLLQCEKGSPSQLFPCTFCSSLCTSWAAR